MSWLQVGIVFGLDGVCLWIIVDTLREIFTD